jgi:hypothetical protein
MLLIVVVAYYACATYGKVDPAPEITEPLTSESPMVTNASMRPREPFIGLPIRVLWPQWLSRTIVTAAFS